MNDGGKSRELSRPGHPIYGSGRSCEEHAFGVTSIWTEERGIKNGSVFWVIRAK